MLSFSIDKQTLIRLDNQQVVTDSYNYLYAYFNFSSDWNNVNKNAIFEINGKTYTMPILNNISLVPWEVIVVPDFTVSAYGFTTTKRITTNSISVETNSFITEPENIPQNQPTPTDYEAYVELVNEALKQINDLSVEAEQVLDQAKQYNEQSQQAATNAANSASQAEASSQSAQASAQNAESSAQNASNSASSAQNSASEASTYAQNAKESETKAEQYSVSAQNSASEAQQYSSSAQESAEQANQSSESAQQYASNAETSANNAAQSAETAKEYSDNVVSLGTQAVENINSAKDAAIQEITQYKDGALTDINSAQTGAISAISQAQQTAVSDITDKGTEQVNNINSAGSTAISNIQSAESESLQKIQDAQNTAIEDINNTADVKIQEIENINSLLPKPTETDIGKAPIAQSDGSYQLEEIVVDAYTKSESDARYAPIEAAIKVSGSGKDMVSLSPTIPWYMQDLKLYGRTTQFTTTGAQLCPPPESKEANGIAFTVLPDGRAAIKGTSPSSYVMFHFLGSTSSYFSEINLPEGDITITCEGLPSTGARFDIRTEDNSVTISLSASNPTGTFIHKATTRYKVYLQLWPDVEFNNIVSIMFNKGSTPLPYEPYTGGMPAPNPDYPQPMVSTGDSGRINAYVAKDAVYIPGLAFKERPEFSVSFDSEDVIFHRMDGVKTYSAISVSKNLSAGTYTLECESVEGDTVLSNYFFEIQETSGYTQIASLNKNQLKTEVTVTDGKYQIIFRAASNVPDSPFRINKLRLYKKIQPLTIPTPNGLYGVPNDKGVVIYQDYYDFKSGLRVVGTAKLLSTEDIKSRVWKFRESDNTGSDRDTAIFTTETSEFESNNALCSILPYSKIMQNTTESFGCGSGQLWLVVNKSRLVPYGFIDDGVYHEENLQPFIDWLNAQSSVEILIVLRNQPEPEAIPSEIMDQYKSIMSYDGTTNIVAPDAMVQASAVADATEYINQKISELSSAILGG